MKQAALLLGLSLCSAGCLSFHRGAMPGEPSAALFAEVEGARVRYTESGEGPAVVLIHGFASSLETWTLVAPELAKTHRVITLDLKGFGWTDRPPGDYSPKAQARLVLALLDQLGVKETAVVGHSWGASVALAVALEQPERITRIALYDAWVYEEQLPAFFQLARADGVGEALFTLFYDERPDEKAALAFYNRRFLSEALVEEIEKALERPGTKAAALAAVRGQRYAAVQQRYRTITAPVQLLWGREDLVTPVTVADHLLSDLPDARLQIFPLCGHFPMLEAAKPSTAALLRFLDEKPSVARSGR